jgi:hypothetical protein
MKNHTNAMIITTTNPATNGMKYMPLHL